MTTPFWGFNNGTKKKRRLISAHADGGPRSRVCVSETLRSAPHRRQRKFPRELVFRSQNVEMCWKKSNNLSNSTSLPKLFFFSIFSHNFLYEPVHQPSFVQNIKYELRRHKNMDIFLFQFIFLKPHLFLSCSFVIIVIFSKWNWIVLSRNIIMSKNRFSSLSVCEAEK